MDNRENRNDCNGVVPRMSRTPAMGQEGVNILLRNPDGTGAVRGTVVEITHFAYDPDTGEDIDDG